MPVEGVDKAVGLLIEKEVSEISKVFNPVRPMVAIFGGAKLEDKIDIMKGTISDMQKGDAI